MKITDWFDPYDVEHIRAYSYLEKTCCWPEGFLPRGYGVSYTVADFSSE